MAKRKSRLSYAHSCVEPSWLLHCAEVVRFAEPDTELDVICAHCSASCGDYEGAILYKLGWRYDDTLWVCGSCRRFWRPGSKRRVRGRRVRALRS